MRYAQVVTVLLAGTLAWGCGVDRRDAGQAAGDGEAAAGEARSGSAADRSLGEFEALGAADVELYLRVMREAARRLANLTDTDRAALEAWRSMSQGAPRVNPPTPEEVAALQRAGELASMDAAVARELGQPHRFSSVSGRVDDFLTPDVEASGDEPVSDQERARVRERIRRFRELDRADSVTLAPHRAELVSLRRQVHIMSPAIEAPDAE